MTVYITDAEYYPSQGVVACHMAGDTDAESQAIAVAVGAPTAHFPAIGHHHVPPELAGACIARGAILIDRVTMESYVNFRARQRRTPP